MKDLLVIRPYDVWIWLSVFVITVVIEFMTVEFVSVWFAIASIPALVLALFNQDPWLQLIVFFLLSILLLAVTRPLVVKYLRRNIVDTNVDAYVGKTALVTSKITEIEAGLVKFEGLIWTAISSESIPEGSKVRILAIEGNKLIVTKIIEEK